MKVLGLLVVLPTLIGFTDAAIASWNLNDGTAVNSEHNDFTTPVDHAETNDVTAVFFKIVAAAPDGSTLGAYSITQPTGKFAIGATGTGTEGEVTLATGQVLDRETDETLVIKIEATEDTGGTVSTGTATVTLAITDVNDNTPVFSAPATSPHSLEIADGSTAGDALYTVTATDADATGTTITYSIHSGDANNDYTIDGSSGAITVATGKTLAKSTTASYELVIYATDSGSPAASGSATLSVTVCDPCGNGAGNHNAGLLSFIITLLMCVKKFM